MIINESIVIENIKNTSIKQDVYTITASKNGGFSLKAHINNYDFYISSKYNPLSEGEKFAQQKYSNAHNIIIYGLGLGYHIKAILNKMQENQRLFILECNMQTTKIAFEQTDITDMLKDDKIVFCLAQDIKEAVLFLKECFSKDDYSFVIYEPSLRAMPNALEQLKEVIQTYNIKIKSHERFEHLLSENSIYNNSQNYKNGGMIFKDKFKGLPCIIVSAGPSLELNINELKEVSKKAIIIAVGRCAKFLYQNNFLPDYFIQTDSQEIVFNHLDIKGLKIPLFMLSTANKKLENYEGEKYILYEYHGAEEDMKPFAVECGGSVATTAMSLAKLMGFSTIILIGQDLCYWSEKRHSGENRTISQPKNGKYIEAIDGQMYYTSTNLYEYKKWFEKFIQKNSQIKFINATAKGAKINGCINVNIKDALKDFSEIK